MIVSKIDLVSGSKLVKIGNTNNSVLELFLSFMF